MLTYKCISRWDSTITFSIGRRSGQSVTASDFGSNGPRFESGRGRCVESLDKALYSHCPRRSLHISFWLSGHPCKIYTGKKYIYIYIPPHKEWCTRLYTNFTIYAMLWKVWQYISTLLNTCNMFARYFSYFKETTHSAIEGCSLCFWHWCRLQEIWGLSMLTCILHVRHRVVEYCHPESNTLQYCKCHWTHRRPEH